MRWKEQWQDNNEIAQEEYQVVQEKLQMHLRYLYSAINKIRKTDSRSNGRKLQELQSRA